MKIANLFSNQKKAERAIDALADKGLENTEIRAIEDWDANSGIEPALMPPVHTAHAASSGVSTIPITEAVPDLKFDNKAKEFFKRSLKEGAVLVTVESEDQSEITTAKSILSDMGGRQLVA